MNAYELADELENLFNRFLHPHSKFQDFLNAATMLRQQADRIAELEGEVSSLKHINKNWQLSETMAYNRIAELEKGLENTVGYHCYQAGLEEGKKAHPAKQLSDEEIEAILKKSMVIKGVWGQPMQELDPMVFARAIIKEITE